MTIPLYDYLDLQEGSPKHLKVWKAWHLILYVCAAVFGMANFVFLQKSMSLVNHNCVLYPRVLEFYAVELPEEKVNQANEKHQIVQNITNEAQPDLANNTTLDKGNGKAKRETKDNETMTLMEVPTVEENATIIAENKTHRLVLDVSRTLFGPDGDCNFAEYMPLLSTVFALVWLTMFTMCAGGGHVRTGLSQPWRILAPALVFALVMVGLTGHSFTLTNGGIHAFCAAFFDITNSTTCSSMDPHIELGWNASWSMSGRTAATRAASAGVWASWACAAALMLARCLAAPDFVVKRTNIILSQDPQQKITPYLKKSQRPRSNLSSPTKVENVSIKSEPETITTELVTASVEQEDSAPTSLMVTPLKTVTPRNTENIELTYAPHERFEIQ